MMYVFTLLLFGVPVIRAGLDSVNEGINVLIAATREGTKFVFGPIIGDQAAWEQLVGAPGPIFIFQLLPLIIVIGSLSAILWHWGILKWITRGFALIFQRTMGMGGPTSLSVAANIFMGQTEAPLLIKPYLKIMTRSELLIVMATGFATIAGSVLVVYVTLLRDTLPAVAAHLITVSIIASPAAVALSMIMVPETEETSKASADTDFKYHSTMDAFATGATDGIAIIWNIATMLIAALALVFITNAILGAIPVTIDWSRRAPPAQPRPDTRLAVRAADVHGRSALGRICPGRLLRRPEDRVHRVRGVHQPRRPAGRGHDGAYAHDCDLRDLRLRQFRLDGHPDRRPQRSCVPKGDRIFLHSPGRRCLPARWPRSWPQPL